MGRTGWSRSFAEDEKLCRQYILFMQIHAMLERVHGVDRGVRSGVARKTSCDSVGIAVKGSGGRFTVQARGFVCRETRSANSLCQAGRLHISPRHGNLRRRFDDQRPDAGFAMRAGCQANRSEARIEFARRHFQRRDEGGICRPDYGDGASACGRNVIGNLLNLISEI